MRRHVEMYAQEMHSSRVKTATKLALEAKRSRLERVSRYAPYGWTIAGDGKTLTRNHDEYEMLLFALETREALGCTWLDTAAALNREGYRQRNAKQWTLHNVRSAVLLFKRYRDAEASMAIAR